MSVVVLTVHARIKEFRFLKSTGSVKVLLDGVVDAYIPDLKYGNDRCAKKWSGVKNYIDTAHNSIVEMASQAVPVFVRILILPGHGSCCHLQSINWLKDYEDKVVLNLMGQYFPENDMVDILGPMADRP